MKKTILLILILTIGIIGTALSVDVFADQSQENKNGKSVKAQDFSAAIINPSSASESLFNDTPKVKSNNNKGTQTSMGMQAASAGDLSNDKTSSLQSRYDKLLEKAQVHGSVRIIVGLNIEFTPEGEFSTTQEKIDQRQKIQDSQNTLLQTVSSFEKTKPHKFKYIPYLSMTVNKNSLQKLTSSPMVKSISEDKFSKPTLVDSIPLIGANAVHTSGFDGSGKFVVIADTGVEINHSAFDGKRIYEACFSSTGRGQGFTFTTVCPNGLDEQKGEDSAVPCSEHDPDLIGCDHGTHVAGIAIGNGPITGVAPGADLIAIQIYSSFEGKQACGVPNTPCALTFTSDQIAGAEHVLDLYNINGYDIVSMNWSLGGDPFTTGTCDDQPRKAIVDSLRSVGIATVAAAGNDFIINAISSPACISSVFSVGATNDSDIVASFSNTGAVLDVLAPGVGILSSIPGNSIGAKSGTSMSSPHVAGAWALFKQASPPASVDDISLALTSTGIPIVDNRPATCCGLPPITKPRIQLDAALAAINTVFCGRSITTFNVMQGTAHNDKLSGTPNDDLIFGNGGDDQIIGADGDDCIFGGGGNDVISGGNGNDTIEGGDGDDHITGREGDDIIFGNDGNDVISGGNGNDTIEGGAGDDQITGRAGNDILHGNEGNDIISAGFDDDTVYGESGNDQLSGNEGNDTIDGGPDTDICSGGTGTNTVTNC